MSKILRRPMFRGGRVDSRGTGITSGLMDDTGYANGGRVGYKDGPDMFGVQYEPSKDVSTQQKNYYDFLKEYGGGKYLEPGATTNIYGEYVTGLEEKTKPMGFLEFAGSVLNPFKPTYGAVSRYGEQKDLEYATSESGKASILADIDRKRKQQAQMILANPKLAPDKIELAKQIIGETEPTEDGKIISRPAPKSRREEIMEEAALYREALGYDDAKSQAVFDALGAAAPAFFKGKNLREAAPQVLEAINKSKAFEAPKDIKQAAGQLAIQRRMLADKAKAEELARLAIYGMRNREGLTDFIKGIPGSFAAGLLPKGYESNPLIQKSLRPGGIYSTTEGEYFYAVPNAKGNEVSGLQKLG